MTGGTSDAYSFLNLDTTIGRPDSKSNCGQHAGNLRSTSYDPYLWNRLVRNELVIGLDSESYRLVWRVRSNPMVVF